MPSYKKFTTDLTNEARQGKRKPAYGCGRLLPKVLDPMRAPDPWWIIVVGPEDSGKSRFVEGAAAACAKAAGDDPLSGASILKLDLEALTLIPGQVEETLADLLEILRRSPQLYLFIDDAGPLFGVAPATDGMAKAAAMLAPAIRGGDIGCITTFTKDEYAMLRKQGHPAPPRAEVAVLAPFNRDRYVDMLADLAPELEQRHKLTIDDTGLHAAAILTEQFVPEKCSPDLVTGILDKACLRYNRKAAAAHNTPELIKGTSLKNLTDKVSAYDVLRTIEEECGVDIQSAALNMKNSLANRIAKVADAQKEPVFHLVDLLVNVRFGFGSPFRPAGMVVLWGESSAPKLPLVRAVHEVALVQAELLTQVDMAAVQSIEDLGKALNEAARKGALCMAYCANTEQAPVQATQALAKIVASAKPTPGSNALRHLIVVFGYETEPGQSKADVFRNLGKAFTPEFMERLNAVVKVG